MKINLLTLCVAVLSSCTFGSNVGKHKIKVFSNLSTYNYSKPDTSHKLNSVLTEISGLSYNTSKNELLAVNDEKGIIFSINIKSGKIVSQQKFHSSGDYEGIEIVGNNIFVLKSNGNLYKVSKEKTETIKTSLSVKNDVEGLGYDVQNNQLLLACKAHALNTEHSKSTKAIYAFNVEQSTFLPDPYLLIKRKEVKAFLKSYNAGDKTLDRSKEFSPSGIAVHPITGNIYILSARASMMFVYTPDHQLSECVFFDKSKLPQPEGICFSAEGTLFISTEGQGKKGKIIIYSKGK